MKINYNINVKTNNLGKPTWCVVNGRPYECDRDKPLYINILNAITSYQRNGMVNPLEDGLYNRAVYWPMSLEFALEKAMSKHYQVEATTLWRNY